VLDAFTAECKKTTTKEECAGLITKLRTGATKAEKDSFGEVCNVPNPNAGGDKSKGLIATKTSKILMLVSLTIANLYFKL
jgi:hypothetical protein